jgi:hypothetical protein
MPTTALTPRKRREGEGVSERRVRTARPTDKASAARQGHSHMPRMEVLEVCPRCHEPTNVSTKTLLCHPCRDVLTREAQHEQEAAYLCAWLFTREAESTRQVRRLRALATAEGLDWRVAPPPILFVERLKRLMAPFLVQGQVLRTGSAA